MKNDLVYLVDMIEIAKRVESKMRMTTRQQFDADDNFQLAITHLLQTIGEAARLVSEPTRETLPNIPCRQITGMRHRIVHDYLNVRPAVVWKVAKTEMERLIADLSPVVDPIIAKKKNES